LNVLGLGIEQRPHASASSQGLSIFIGLVGAFAVSSLLIVTAGANVPDAIAAFLRGAFGSRAAIAETLVQSTPLILTGLAVVIAFRARVWNIGAEGQFFAGAMATIWVTLTFPDLPAVAMLPLIIVASAAGGAAWGVIPGILRVRFGANEVVVTVMMNFVIQFILSYLLAGPWRDPDSFYLQSDVTPESASFPSIFPPSRLHLGFVIAVAMVLLVHFVLRRTTLGLEIRAIGSNQRVSRLRGINVGVVIVVVMAMSGALAGLAGGGEIAGLHHRLRLDISTGYGFTGIMIALLGRMNPYGALIAAVGFGALVNGSTAMQITTGVPVALVFAIQGLTLIFVIVAEGLARYRVIWRTQYV
jgi:ABC-type uncharacterized transport system permease subunit